MSEQPPADEGGRSLLEDLVDYGFYAPLGAAIRMAESLPELVEKGRSRVEGRIATARLVGRFAVKEARRRVESTFGAPPSAPPESSSRVDQEASLDDGPTRGGDDPPVVRDNAPVTVQREAAAAAQETTAGEQASQGDATRPVARRGDEAPPVEDLAIPNYDSLAASQVVPRLVGLAPDELEAIRRYESAHRRRRTVLSRVTQLQDGPAGATG